MKRKIVIALILVLCGIVLVALPMMLNNRVGRIGSELSSKVNMISARQSAQMSSDSYSGSSGGAVAPVQPVPKERKVIMTAELSLTVKSVTAAQEKITDISRLEGGFVSGANTMSNDDGTKSGSVTIRTPEARFNDTMKKMKALGKVDSETITGEDVTEEFVDLDARLRNLKREEESFLDVLKMAHKVGEILQVEAELGRVRGEIEQVTGRIKYLKDRTALATITVQLSEKAAVASPGQWTLSDTAKNAWNALLKTVRALLGMAIWLAVFSPIVLLAGLAWYLLKRIRKPKAGTQ